MPGYGQHIVGGIVFYKHIFLVFTFFLLITTFACSAIEKILVQFLLLTVFLILLNQTDDVLLDPREILSGLANCLVLQE